MGGDAFKAALDTLDALLASKDSDAASVSAAFDVLKAHRSARPSADDLQRLFAHCYAALARWPQLPNGAPDREAWLIFWQVTGLIEGTFTDEAARSRALVQGGHARFVGLNYPRGERPSREVPPLPHIPLDTDQARDLAAPYLARLEAEIADHPYGHLKLAWNVISRPVPPFDAVFEDWLGDLDARAVGTGTSLTSLKRARALATLADVGRQCMAWTTCEAELLPQLEDPHPMVAACAGRFLGSLYSDPEARFNRGTAPPLIEMMAHLTEVKTCRRAVAGGFCHGIGALTGLPDEVGDGFDLDDWTKAILAHPLEEPYVPGAQAFWFPVHEHYWNKPDFVGALIDMDREWIALMCATEAGFVEGMRPILDRLADSNDADIAASAAAHIGRNYPD